MQQRSTFRTGRVARSPWASRAAALGFGALLVAPPPNLIPPGRSTPHGFCISAERFAALREHHAFGHVLHRQTTMREFCAEHRIDSAELDRILDFNREYGIVLPTDETTAWPIGIPIWRPPVLLNEQSCFVWIRSMTDGWVAPQVAAATEAEATHRNGMERIQLAVYPIPWRLQREWSEIADAVTQGASLRSDLLTPELRRVAESWNWSQRLVFANQFVPLDSTAIRTIVELPLAPIDGTVRLDCDAATHYFDNQRREVAISPTWLQSLGVDAATPPTSSVLVQLLVAATGTALLSCLWFARRSWRPKLPAKP